MKGKDCESQVVNSTSSHRENRRYAQLSWCPLQRWATVFAVRTRPRLTIPIRLASLTGCRAQFAGKISSLRTVHSPSGFALHALQEAQRQSSIPFSGCIIVASLFLNLAALPFDFVRCARMSGCLLIEQSRKPILPVAMFLEMLVHRTRLCPKVLS